jgi:hypothetical protein
MLNSWDRPSGMLSVAHSAPRSVIACSVEHTQEFGIRPALGAAPSRIRRHVVGDALTLA